MAEREREREGSTEDGEELVPEPVLDRDERFALRDASGAGALRDDRIGGEGIFVAEKREKEKSGEKRERKRRGTCACLRNQSRLSDDRCLVLAKSLQKDREAQFRAVRDEVR